LLHLCGVKWQSSCPSSLWQHMHTSGVRHNTSSSSSRSSSKIGLCNKPLHSSHKQHVQQQHQQQQQLPGKEHAPHVLPPIVDRSYSSSSNFSSYIQFSGAAVTRSNFLSCLTLSCTVLSTNPAAIKTYPRNGCSVPCCAVLSCAMLCCAV
jgi:hypothetical protein